MRWVIVLSIVFLLVLPMFSSAETFFVATNGNDNTNDGKSLSSPFRTIQRARDTIRATGTDGHTVNIRGGVYHLSNTLTFSSQDSGAANNENVYQAYQGENVRIVGGIKLNSNDFSTVTQSSYPNVWSRIDSDSAARGRVMQLDLKQYPTDYGNLVKRESGTSVEFNSALELFFNQEPMQLARWPNKVENKDVDFPVQSFTLIGVGINPGINVAGTYIYQGQTHSAPYYKHESEEWHIWQSDANRLYYLTNENGSGQGQNEYHWLSHDPLDPYGRDYGPATGNLVALYPAPGFATMVTANDAYNQFTYYGNRPERWNNAEDDIWVHGYFGQWWRDSHIKVSDIDFATKTFTLANSPQYTTIKPGFGYYVENLLEEIDLPGEWYLNRDTGILYFWPPNNNINGEIYVSTLETPLVSIDGASYLTFKDLTFEIGRSRLIYIEDSSNVKIENSIIRNSGGEGVRIIRGSNNGIDSSEIYNIGTTGVFIEAGDRRNLIPCNHYVRNSDIHHFGRWVWSYRNGVKIRLDSVGVEVSHNEIHDAPHFAVSFNGNNHLIEYNDIHNVLEWCNDCGSIYAWTRDWGSRGTKIRYNFIHDIYSATPDNLVTGVYLDGGTTDTDVYGNIFYNIEGQAFHLNGGRDNIMENNIIAKCGAYGIRATSRVYNLFECGSYSEDLMLRIKNLGINHKVPPWSTAYPEFALMPSVCSQLENSHWLYPEGCIFSRNLGWDITLPWMHERNFSGSGTYNKFLIEDNIEDANPLFVDEANYNMNLRPNSPAYSIPGWQNIPFDEIGIIGGSSPPPPLPPSNDPIAEYDFDQTYGSTAIDNSDKNNHCDVYGAAWTSGILGNSLLFDGVNDYLDCGNSNSLDIPTNGEITISAWVNVNSFPVNNGWSYILGKGYDGSEEAYYFRLGDYLGTRVLEVGSYDRTVRHKANWSISGWNTNSWHHVVGLYDGTSWKIYFDGNQKLSRATDGPESNARDLFIGAFDTTGADRFFSGKIDEVKIYNRALSAQEIQSLYQEGASNNPSDIDQDGDTDFNDLILVAVDFGKTYGYNSRADTNIDGEVDIFDIVFVASRI